MSNPKDTKTMRSLVEAANNAKKPTKAKSVGGNKQGSDLTNDPNEFVKEFAYEIESELSRVTHGAVRCMHSVDPKGNTIEYHIFTDVGKFKVTIRNSFKAVGFVWQGSVVVVNDPTPPMDIDDFRIVAETYTALATKLKIMLRNLNKWYQG